MSIFQILYLFIMALVLAALEVQIEGEHGWAARLPCWRPTGRWYARVFTRVMGGKEMTGYHVGVFLFAFLMFHLPYVWGLAWSASSEFQTLSAFFLFVVIWDFLWFVINPHYGIRKFHPGCVAWHKIWFGPAPVDYYGALAFSFLFHAGTGVNSRTWGLTFAMFVVLTVCAMLITEIVKKFRNT